MSAHPYQKMESDTKQMRGNLPFVITNLLTTNFRHCCRVPNVEKKS